MALSCREATRASLAALGGHAVEAQRLEFEAHLAGCVRCGDRHGLSLAVVHGLKEAETETLSLGAREAVRRALGAAPPVVTERAAGSRRWLPRLAVGLALGGVVAAGAVGLRTAPRATAVTRVSGDVTIASDAAISLRGAGVPGTADDAVVLNSVKGGRAQVADATVDLAGGTELWWSVREQVGHLRRGRVTVDVEHRPGRRLEIRTGGFVVQVVGTRFTVEATGVHTERGVVRVVMPDGRVVARLQAGQSWSLPIPPVLAREPAGSVSGLGSPEGRSTRGAVAGGAGLGDSGALDVAPPPANPSPASGGDGLRLARRALGRGDAAGARRLVAPLFRQARKVAVEARAIFAESFLVEGRYADAIDGFRLVVRDFSGTEQAESALFAVAQLESEHGDATEARAALQSYLSRHPRGRFVREAKERLARLPARER